MLARSLIAGAVGCLLLASTAFAAETFKDWFFRREPRNQDQPPVILWADTFNNSFNPEILKAGARILVVSNEHPEALERMRPDPALETRVRAVQSPARLRHARSSG